jgi:hypothetical protein
LTMIFETAKSVLVAPYVIAYRTLKLDDVHARDSILININHKIRNIFEEKTKFTIIENDNNDDNLSAISDTVVYLSTALKIVERTVTRNRGKYQSYYVTCAVIIESWIYSQDGKPLWNNQEDINTPSSICKCNASVF